MCVVLLYTLRSFIAGLLAMNTVSPLLSLFVTGLLEINTIFVFPLFFASYGYLAHSYP